MARREGSRGALKVIRWCVTLIGTGAFVVALLHSLGGVGAVSRALLRIPAEELWIAVGLSALAVVIGVCRWQLVLRTMGFRLPFRRGLVATLAVWPLVVVVPSRSNELLRAAAIRDRVPFWAGAGSVLAEKAVDFHTLLWLGALGAAAQGLRGWAIAMSAGVVAMWGAALFFWFGGRGLFTLRLLRRFEAKVSQLGEAFRAIRQHPLQALWLTLISVAVRAVTVALLAVLLWGLGVRLALWPIACLAPAAMVAGLLPLTFTGIGVRDAAFLWLVRHSGHPVGQPELVVAATLGYSLISTWLIAVVSLPVMIRVGLKPSAVVSDGPAGSLQAPTQP
jgi:uncharacterized membrane protein YbhN (UPF0104 family)